jgi:hypothetical protein
LTLDELNPETFLAKTILEVVDLEDSELKAQFLRLKRKRRMNKIDDNDLIRLVLIEDEIAARKAENV